MTSSRGISFFLVRVIYFLPLILCCINTIRPIETLIWTWRRDSCSPHFPSSTQVLKVLVFMSMFVTLSAMRPPRGHKSYSKAAFFNEIQRPFSIILLLYMTWCNMNTFSPKGLFFSHERLCVFVRALLTDLKWAGCSWENMMSCIFLHRSGFSNISVCAKSDEVVLFALVACQSNLIKPGSRSRLADCLSICE